MTDEYIDKLLRKEYENINVPEYMFDIKRLYKKTEKNSKMELTREQQHLINGLQLLNLDKDTIVATMIACQEDGKAIEMINYIADNIDKGITPTEEMLLNKILDMNKDN